MTESTVFLTRTDPDRGTGGYGIGRGMAGELGAVLRRGRWRLPVIGAKGFTTGHYPQSIALSTVGGWVATRAAGQFSTRYGNIEDLCLGLEAVRPSGEVVRLSSFPRASVGPSLRDLFIGNEGALGIVTEVTLRVHPVPEAREATSFGFAGIREALEASRRVLRAGWRPAVLLAYDETEAHRHFHVFEFRLAREPGDEQHHAEREQDLEHARLHAAAPLAKPARGAASAAD